MSNTSQQLYVEGQRSSTLADAFIKELLSQMPDITGHYTTVQIDHQIYHIKVERGPDKPRPTIEELEKILNSEEDIPIVINSDGSITAEAVNV